MESRIRIKKDVAWQRNLMPLKRKKSRMKYATFDIEAPEWVNQIGVGFYDGKEYKSFWGKNCISDFLDFFLQKKYESWHVFAHNFGKYDGNFILQELMENRMGDYRISFIKSNSRIIQLKIRRNKRYWYFNDSFALLPTSLSKLTHDFDVEHKKLDMDYSEVGINQTTKRYMRNDVLGLYEVLNKFENYVKQFGVGLEMTSARQALMMFRTFLKFPLMTYRNKESFIRKSYYGGRCEIFKMHENDLNYYDINSLYPYCMLKHEMPVGSPIVIHGKPPDNGISFCEAIVKIPKDIHIPPLPFRMHLESGAKLVFPTGKLRGVWDYSELKNAERIGCDVKYIKSISFCSDYLFTDYIKHWYKVKKESDKKSALYFISKLLMNSLYGKFGQSRDAKQIIANPEDCIGLYPLYEDYNIYEKDITSKATHILPAISSHITALARIELFNWMEDTGFRVVYCDTDSIITQERLPTSAKIGDMKLEKKSKEGIFLLPKLYAFREGEIKAKGYDVFKKKEEKKKAGITYDSFRKALFAGDYSDFNIEYQRFGLFSENIRRNNPIVSMVNRKKSIVSRYDKRHVSNDFTTTPLRVGI